MRKIFTFLAAVLLTASVFAQSPEKMSYQAVIRDASDNLATSQNIGMQISILQGFASGTAVYVETQCPTTNANGLVSIEIGAGTVISGDFATIDWSNGPYFIKTETDPAGGTSYSITGTSQLLSVPYALHAKTAETITGGITETDPAVSAHFDFTDAANGDLLQFNGTKWVKVTPTYISDYTVTEGDVTAHQAALTLTESQISDLQSYLTSEVDGSVTNEIELPTDAVYGDMSFFDGTSWKRVGAPTSDNMVLTYCGGIPTWTASGQCPIEVGDFHEGGVVFYLFQSGDPGYVAGETHGFICAVEDQDGGSGIQWYNGSYTTTGAAGEAIGDGETNTATITGSQGAGSYAAKLCEDYTDGSYTDWFLPSKDELILMYQNKATIDVTAGANGGSSFAGAYYWSSTESNNYDAWIQYITNGYQTTNYKDFANRVRAVRAF